MSCGYPISPAATRFAGTGGGHLFTVVDDDATGLRDRARRLQLRHRAEPAQLRAIRRRVARWAEQNAVPADTVIDLQLALGEAVSNGVEHAYLDGDPGMVDVELEIRPAAERANAHGTGAGLTALTGADAEQVTEDGPADATAPDQGEADDTHADDRQAQNGLSDVVAVRVMDHGRWRPPPLRPGYRGRGLALIRRLARDMQVSATHQGTQVCFDIPFRRRQPDTR